MVRHHIEYDPSGRATCKTCKQKIPKGALRLCVNQSLETSEMQQKDYRHLTLACLDPATLRGVARHTFDLDRLVAALQPADQAKAREVMAQALKSVPSSVAPGAAAKKAAAAGAPAAAEGAGAAAASAGEGGAAGSGPSGATKKTASGTKKADPPKKESAGTAGPKVGPKTPAEARQTRAGTKRKAAELGG